jgi:hypothetical protein
VTLSLGLLGSVGLIGSRFAYGISLGLFISAAFLLFRPARSRQGRAVKAVAGSITILGLFLLFAH